MTKLDKSDTFCTYDYVWETLDYRRNVKNKNKNKNQP